jgi:hypothetical protein
MSNKDTNPKDAIGIRKAPLSALPIRVLWRVGLAMLEGAVKYGRHNYRAAGVRASVYFDAGMRHFLQWWEGEDIDRDSGVNHIDKLIADLMVLRDSMLQGNWVDDRPPSGAVKMDELNSLAGRIIDMHADKNPRHYTIADTYCAPESEQLPLVDDLFGPLRAQAAIGNRICEHLERERIAAADALPGALPASLLTGSYLDRRRLLMDDPDA